MNKKSLDEFKPFDAGDHAPLGSEQDWAEMLWLRPNRRLPRFEENHPYALTVSGYGYSQHVLNVDPTGEQAWELVMRLAGETSGWDGPFASLRVALFYLQRRIRWLEGSADDDEGRQLYDGCYQALCDAWDREAPDHLDEVRRAHEVCRRLQSGDGTAR